MRKGTIKAVVPARFGSQRVKIKSLRLLNGKPLIEYILGALKGSSYLQDVYVNSDSELLGKVALRNGVKFYLRKPELATSASLIDDYLYDFMKHEPSDYLAVVNPTSPFITAEELDQAVEHFLAHDFDTMLCCEKVQTHCFYQGQPINFSTDGQHPRSQDLDPVLALNFAITMWDCRKFMAQYEAKGHGVYTGKIGFFTTDGEANIDIDYEDDFQMAEFVARFKASGQSLEATYDEVAQEIVEKNIDTRN